MQLILIGPKKYTNFFEQSLSTTLLKFLLLSFLMIWIVGFIQPTFLTKNNSISNYFFAKIYSRVCHQESSKCIIIDKESMLVCARCAGIYFGALITGLLLLINRIPELKIKVFIFAALPLVIDVCFAFFGVYRYSQTIAFVTGLSFGGVVYLFFLSELENIFLNKSIKRNE